jgi:hypothetical protein
MVMKKKRTANTDEGVKARTLLLTTADGDVRITIPPGARVTFGPTIPYQKRDNGYQPRESGYSLRVYETAKNDSLVAVFGGVLSFRDSDIPHAKLIIREAGKSVWKSDEEGYKVETEGSREKMWIDSLHQLEAK